MKNYFFQSLTHIHCSAFGSKICYKPALLLYIEYQRVEFEFVALKFGDQMDSFSRQLQGGSEGFV